MSEAPQILLAHHLKKLKLPTFLREHEKIARLCAAEGKDHSRFLLRLAELELIDREGRMVERRIKAARFPTVKSLDSRMTGVPRCVVEATAEPIRSSWRAACTSLGSRLGGHGCRGSEPTNFRLP